MAFTSIEEAVSHPTVIPAVKAYARRLAPERADDYMQGAFLRVVQRWDVVQTEGAGYLRTTMVHSLLSQHALEQRRRMAVLDETYNNVPAPQHDEADYDDHLVWKCLPHQRLLFFLKAQLDLPYGEIAELMGMDIEHTYLLVRQGRRIIKTAPNMRSSAPDVFLAIVRSGTGWTRAAFIDDASSREEATRRLADSVGSCYIVGSDLKMEEVEAMPTPTKNKQTKVFLKTFKIASTQSEQVSEQAGIAMDTYSISSKRAVVGMVLTQILTSEAALTEIRAMLSGAIEKHGYMPKVPDPHKSFIEAGFASAESRTEVLAVIKTVRNALPAVVHQYHVLGTALYLWLSGNFTVNFEETEGE